MDNHDKMICAAILTAGLVSNTNKTTAYYAATKFWQVLQELEDNEPNSRYEADPENLKK